MVSDKAVRAGYELGREEKAERQFAYLKGKAEGRREGLGEAAAFIDENILKSKEQMADHFDTLAKGEK